MSRPFRAASSAASLTRFRRSAPTSPAVSDATSLRSHRRSERHTTRVDLQDFGATVPVRGLHRHAAVETTGAQQGRIEHIGAVGRGQDDHRLRASRSHPSPPGAGSASARARRCRRRCCRRRACRPIASSSSTKMIAGAASFASLNRSRTREAPTPTIISMNSEPDIEKNGTPASPAVARASSVLPVPGGADQQDTFRHRPTEARVLGRDS